MKVCMLLLVSISNVVDLRYSVDGDRRPFTNLGSAFTKFDLVRTMFRRVSEVRAGHPAATSAIDTEGFSIIGKTYSAASNNNSMCVRFGDRRRGAKGRVYGGKIETRHVVPCSPHSHSTSGGHGTRL